MRFTKPFWSGIADGSITLAFRRWARPTVVVGRPYRTGGGRVEVTSVDVVEPEAITDAEARRAGYADAQEVRDAMATMTGGRSRSRGGAGTDVDDRSVYRVGFRLLDEPDPRAVLADQDTLSAEDVAEIAGRLERLDRASKHGPWTGETLALIRDHPEVRAPDLAELVGRETQPFKLDVRKLKNLGLTLSFNPGYRLSPRGQAYLDAAGDSVADSTGQESPTGGGTTDSGG